MSHSSLLSRIELPREIRACFAWHCQQGVPLLLMTQSGEGPVSAKLLDPTEDCISLTVVLRGMDEISPATSIAYALIGSTQDGANFLASGRMWSQTGIKDCFKLSFPQWVDISQSRGSYSCSSPGSHFVHFSALDPHLNDIICRVKNVSLDGLAIEWNECDGSPPGLNEATDACILQSQDNRVQLGRLRVAHIAARAQGFAIGLDFEKNVPAAFIPLVLSAQFSHYTA